MNPTLPSFYFRILIFLVSVSCLSPSVVSAEEADADSLLRLASQTLYNNPKEASSLANQVLQLCDTSIPDSICREAMITYGDAEQLLGNFDLSIRILYDAAQMVDSTDRHTVARLAVLQGRVFSKLGDYSRANEFNSRATAIFKSLGDSAMVAKCYSERGVTLLNTNEYPSAEHFFRKSVEIARELKDLESIARNLNNMCLYPGNSEEKLKMIEEAIAINRNLESKWAMGENYNNKGKQLCYAGRFQDAIASLATARDYIDVIEARELLCDNYEYMAMACAGMGNYKEAYANMEKMAGLVSELQRRNSLRTTDLDLAAKRISDQQRATDRQQRDYRIQILNRNLWILIAGIVIFAICCVLFYVWFKHKKDLEIMQANQDLTLAEKEVDSLRLKQQELELENARNMLESNRKELTGFAAFLKSRNEMMDRIRDMLREGCRLSPENMAAHMKKISAFISTYASHDNTSRTILVKAEDKNRNFMNNLLARHPDLTKGERNLALLIRGGLASKEIAMLLGLKPETVSMNRYRLRKSLGLTQDTDLHDYLQTL